MKPATYNVDETLATCTLTIDHQALCENWRTLDKMSGSARTAAVIKANGYGLGLGEVGLSLAAAGCEVFFVATPDEGVRLRRLIKSREIFVFSGLNTRNAAAYAESNLIPVLNRFEDIAVWAEFWKLRGSRRPCALQIDTGMNRLGLCEADIQKLVGDKELLHSINIITVMSHLACGDEADHKMNGEQLARFKQYSALFGGCELSLANSAGIHLGSDYHFNLVRPGIALYGGECGLPGESASNVVATAKAGIVQIRTMQKGEVIGYGGTHVFAQDTKVALASIGYSDGYHRATSGSGTALRDNKSPGALGAIDAHKIPVLGRVSMDYTAFDVSDVPDAVLENASQIELFGDQIRLDDVARAAGTIGYEILTSLGQRYYRNHINQPEHSPQN